MSALALARLSSHVLQRLIDGAPATAVALTDDHRRALAERFRALASARHRRLDSWTVEAPTRATSEFRWSPTTARRVLANAALRIRARDPSSSVLDAVDAEVEAQLLRASAGAPSGSLATWLATSHRGELAVVRAEAANWATQVVEAAATLTSPWTIAPSDAYYDVARARTTLRGRRDVIVAAHSARVLLRVRAGAPGPSAGAGLRADLAIDALAHPEGHGALRILGLWPEAGVVLAVDGTIEDLRAGARALLRTAALRSCAQCEMAA